MVDAFRTTRSGFAQRLLAALSAAESLGGDLRGRQSAALLIVRGERTDDADAGVLLDLRVDDDPEPIAKLARTVEIAMAFHPMWEEIRGAACRGPVPPTPEQSARAIEVLEHVVRPLGARTIVPGHGPVFEDPGPIDATLDYLRFVQDVAARGRQAGLSPLQAAQETELGRFAGWADAERIAGNLHRAYAELGGAPPGAPIDILAALSDMVAYNAGAPLSCLA